MKGLLARLKTTWGGNGEKNNQSTTETSSADRPALIAFFEAAGGENWTNKDNWGIDSAPVSSWHGVSVNSHGRVVKIELLDNNLKGSSLECLVQLGALQELGLSRNKLTGRIPRRFGSFGALRKLNLNNNVIDGSIPETLGTLATLQELQLSGNRLLGTMPPMFLANLAQLEVLNLSGNLLHGAIPPRLSGLSKLRVLNLRRNMFAGCLPLELGNVTALQELDLTHNGLTGRIPHVLGNITGLKTLLLRRNKLEGVVPEELGNLADLQELGLSSNRLEGFPKKLAAGLLKLPDLRIYLGRNPWKEPPPGVVSRGLQAIIRYHTDIERSNSRESWTLKVVVVGAVCAGKSSLVRSLMARTPFLVPLADRTGGVDVHVEEPFKPDESRPVELVFWDFAGHDDYYSTHSLFISKGALFLLVVDLARFVADVSGRSDAIHIWLDTLLCRTPGAVVQIVATHIDQLRGGLEDAVHQLRLAVAQHNAAKREEHERDWRKSGQKEAQSARPTLRVVHDVLTVSCKEGTNLPELGKELGRLAVNGTANELQLEYSTTTGFLWGAGATAPLFPDLGQNVPKVWARACAVMNALRVGIDPHEAARLEGASPVVNHPIRQISLRDAETIWEQVVGASEFVKEVEPGNEAVVLKDAIRLREHEGVFLLEHGLLYLDPTWINALLRAILDHRLQDPDTHYWDRELMAFDKLHPSVEFHKLVLAHQTFCATGKLTVSYLWFLWRDVQGIQEEVFELLLRTMCKHGVLFSDLGALPGTGESEEEEFCRMPSGTPFISGEFGIGSDVDLFVPVRLQSYVTDDQLKHFSVPCLQNKWRRQLVFRIWQSYVPPGIIGLLMARLLPLGEVEFHCAWSRGISFMLGGSEVILYLNAANTQDGKSEIEVNVAGPTRSDEVEAKVVRAKAVVEGVLKENFPGLRFDLGRGVRSLEGDNALMERIDSLEAHLDVKLDLIEAGVARAAESSCESLRFVKSLQGSKCPYPHLVVVREHKPGSNTGGGAGAGKSRVLSKALFKSFYSRAKGVGVKDMRLQFQCPCDFSLVPCGPQGEGYKFDQARDWLKKLYPVVQVTAVIAKVALKAASGLDLPVSEYLNAVKTGTCEQLADSCALDNEALHRVILGEEVAGADMQGVSRDSYAALKRFMDKEQRRRKKPGEGYVDFRHSMSQEGDGRGGMVWVSTRNVEKWRASHAIAPSR